MLCAAPRCQSSAYSSPGGCCFGACCQLGAPPGMAAGARAPTTGVADPARDAISAAAASVCRRTARRCSVALCCPLIFRPELAAAHPNEATCKRTLTCGGGERGGVGTAVHVHVAQRRRQPCRRAVDHGVQLLGQACRAGSGGKNGRRKHVGGRRAPQATSLDQIRGKALFARCAMPSACSAAPSA